MYNYTEWRVALRDRGDNIVFEGQYKAYSSFYAIQAVVERAVNSGANMSAVRSITTHYSGPMSIEPEQQTQVSPHIFEKPYY